MTLEEEILDCLVNDCEDIEQLSLMIDIPVAKDKLIDSLNTLIEKRLIVKLPSGYHSDKDTYEITEKGREMWKKIPD